MKQLAMVLLILFSPWGLSQELSLHFGPEFTFPDPHQGIEDESKFAEYRRHVYRHLITNQDPESQFKTNQKQNKFSSPNQWWFAAKPDVGVIEVTMKPMPLTDWVKFKDDIQDAVFVSAYNIGAFPAQFLGGGHINLDTEFFLKNPLLLRNFIVDFWNHNELALGIFNYDTHNAISFSLLDLETRVAIEQLILKFDTLLSTKPKKLNADFLVTWLNDIHQLQSESRDEFWPMWRDDVYKIRFKNTDLNFSSAVQKFEIRAVRPQANLDVWIRQISLIQARIKYLSKINQPIPLKPLLKTRLNTDKRIDAAKLNPPVDPQQALHHFYRYVTESGELWENHQDYIWPAWIKSKALAKFNCGVHL